METLDQIKERLLAYAPKFAKKIAPMFKKMGWKWLFVGVPSEKEILRTIKVLINIIELTPEDTDFHVATGRIAIIGSLEECSKTWGLEMLAGECSLIP